MNYNSNDLLHQNTIFQFGGVKYDCPWLAQYYRKTHLCIYKLKWTNSSTAENIININWEDETLNLTVTLEIWLSLLFHLHKIDTFCIHNHNLKKTSFFNSIILNFFINLSLHYSKTLIPFFSWLCKGKCWRNWFLCMFWEYMFS